MTGLYLMHTRECYNADIEVYKLGRSKTLDNRVKQYPNGSKILFMMNCINSILLESILIKLFKTKYVQQTLYGTEYFLGNQKEMIKDIINCILTQDIAIVPSVPSVPSVPNIPSVPNKQNTNHIKTQNNIVFNIQMSDRTCPDCKKIFNFPSRLKLHFENVIHCKKTEEYISSFFLSTKIINNFNCNKCNFTFVQKSSLNRHLKNSNCSQQHTTK